MRIIPGQRWSFLIRLVLVSAIVAAVFPVVLVGLAGQAGATPPGEITTIAGTDFPGPSAASSVPIDPVDVVSEGGSIYLSDLAQSVVRKVDSSGTETLIAGNGGASSGGDAGPSTSAALFSPWGLAVDSSGDVFIADSENSRVREVPASSGSFYGQAMTKGNIYTVAGGGSAGTGDGGPATSATLGEPFSVTIDASGNVVFADYLESRIRVVAASTGTFYGQAMTQGDIYTVGGNGSTGYSGDGGPATSAELEYSSGVALDSSGDVVVVDFGNDRVRMIAASTGTFYGVAMTKGDIYTIAGNGTYGYSGDGGVATSAELGGPYHAAVDGSGNVIIGDINNARVRVVASRTGTLYGQAMTQGHIYTIAGNGTSGYAGDGGAATSAELGGPEGVAVDGSGNVIVAATANNRLRVIAASTGTFYGVAMTKSDIYTIAGNGTFGYSGDGAAANSAGIDRPNGVAADSSGNTVVADSGDNRIRVIAATTGTFYGQSMTNGDIYTIAGNGIASYSGDGGSATSAELNDPNGVAIDGSGNVVFSDLGNDRVRVIASSSGTFYGQAMTKGDIYTIAGGGSAGTGDGGPATSAELNQPAGVAIDGSGNVVVADSGNGRIRVIAINPGTFYGQTMARGDIYTIAGGGSVGGCGGGSATSASLSQPFGVSVDAGNVVVAVGGEVCLVAGSTGSFFGEAMTSGDMYTIYSGRFVLEGVATDNSGNVVVADTYAQGIQVIAAGNGTYYGQAMTSGHAYLVAGSGTGGYYGAYGGDGGPATSALVNDPVAVALDPAGDLIISDNGNNRVREVTGGTSQTITFTSSPTNPAYLGTYAVSATGGSSGNPVTFSSGSTSICTLSGSTVSFIGVGTCKIDANQAGNATFYAAPQAIQSFTVAKAPQTVTFTSTKPSDASVGGMPYVVSASGGLSGNPVTVAIDNASTSVCALGGTSVSFIGVGICTIDASQAGNADYNAGSAQQSFAVSATDAFSYAAGGGSGSAPAPGGGLDGTTITLAANSFTYPGYSFAGWSDGLSTYAAGATYTLASNGAPITFTAQWSANPTDNYSYAAGGGSGTAPTAGSGLDGTTITLAGNPFTYAGHTFVGWSDGTTTYAAGGTYLLASNGAPITFSAQWSTNTIDTVTFNPEGGSAVTSISGPDGSPITLPTAPTYPGYVFDGWFATASGGSALTSPFTIPVGGTTLYAQWSANASDTVAFNSEGGSAVTSVSGPDGSPITLPTAPTYPGYVFDGWFANPSGGSALTSPYTIPVGGTTVYAQWTAAPTSAVLVPSKGATLSGTATTLDASASNATSVKFLLFGGTYGFSAPVLCTATLTYYGWVCAWNTTTVPNGSYVLVSEASGAGGSTFSSGVSITVNNPLPTTSILIPSKGATLSGTAATLDASASNATSVEFLLFGGSYGYNGHDIGTATPTYYGWVYAWNSATVSNGNYTLVSAATGAGGSAFSSGVGIAVSN